MAVQFLFSLLVFLSQTTIAAPLIVKAQGGLGALRIELDLDFDSESRRFQLDTGANTSMVALDEHTDRYESMGQATAVGASGKRYSCDLIQPWSVSVDSFRVEKPTVRRCDFGSKSFNNLGLDILANKVVSLDFQRREISILDDVGDGWDLKEFDRIHTGHLKIPMQLQGRDILAFFDTGAGISSVDTVFVEANPGIFQKIVTDQKGVDISGNPVEMKFYKVSKIKVGSLELKDVTFAAFDFGKLRIFLGDEVPVILGNNAIVQADWLFDLKSNKWAVRPHTGPLAIGSGK